MPAVILGSRLLVASVMAGPPLKLSSPKVANSCRSSLRVLRGGSASHPILTLKTCGKISLRLKNKGCPPSKSLAPSSWASPRSSATSKLLGKKDRCIRGGAPADARRQTSAQGGSWKQTCGSDVPLPSPRGASTCEAWQGWG